MAGLVRNRVSARRIPSPDGETPEQASTIYRMGPGEYPEMPMPATHFVSSSTALRSIDVVPSRMAGTTSAGVVKRKNRMNGYEATAGRQSYETPVPQEMKPVESSKFQEWLIGPQINYIINRCLYRCGYPAASVMLGGLHNLALSTRVDQLVTRSSGGPGKAAMTTPQRRFSRVQNVPRYSTAPGKYKTKPAKG